MKKTLFAILLAALTLMSCQTKTKPAVVDTEAAKAAVTQVLDKFDTGMNTRNANSLLALFMEDCFICGTDSKELLTKEEWSTYMKDAFADTTLNVNMKADKREIRIAKDGASAMAIEQTMFKFFCPKIPLRIVYHLVKNNDAWMIDFFSIALIPNNEDIGKLNKALE
jgi:uncharacterized protein (TIGR02246 family)